MEIIAARPEQVDAMMAITDQAKANMAAMGIDQWQAGYPNRAVWEADVAAGAAYVVLDEGRVAGMFCYGTEPDGMVSVRIDTHADNAPMRRAVEKGGFTFCGGITLTEGPEAGAPRIAFEKVLG